MSYERRQDLLERLTRRQDGSALDRQETEAIASQAQLPLGAEHRLGRTIARLRGDREGLLRHLQGLSGADRLMARVVVLREFGLERGRQVCSQAFGNKGALFPVLVAGGPSLWARYARARAQGLAEVVRAMTRMGARPDAVRDTLVAAEPAIRQEAQALLSGAGLPIPDLWRQAKSPGVGAATMLAVGERRAVTLFRRTEGPGDRADPEHPAVQEALQRRGGGEPLPQGVRRQMEDRFGISFALVRIHTDGLADRAARAVNARAFTAGEDIFFAGGAFQPASVSGVELLAHELTHVVQGWQGRIPVAAGGQVQMSHPGDALEREAEGAAERLTRPASPGSRPDAAPFGSKEGSPGESAAAAPVTVPTAQRAEPALLARKANEPEEKEEKDEKEKKEETYQGGGAEQAAPAAEGSSGEDGGASAAGPAAGADGAAKASGSEVPDDKGEAHGADAAAGKTQAEPHAEGKEAEAHASGAAGAEGHADDHAAGGQAEAQGSEAQGAGADSHAEAPKAESHSDAVSAEAHGGAPTAASAKGGDAVAGQPAPSKASKPGADRPQESQAAPPQAAPPSDHAQPAPAEEKPRESAAHQERAAAHPEQAQAAHEQGPESKKPEAKPPADARGPEKKKAVPPSPASKEKVGAKKAEPPRGDEEKAAEGPDAQARPGGAGGKDAAAAPSPEAAPATAPQPKDAKESKAAKEAEGTVAKGKSAAGGGPEKDHAAHGAAGGHGAARGGGGGGGGGARKPEDDPDFQAAKGRIAQGGAQQAAHPGAGAAAGAAQAAAVSPAGEVQSQAEARHLDKMQAQKPKEFSKEAFKAAVMAKIGEAAPRNPDEVKQFKNSGKLDSIKNDVSGKVQEGKEQTAGDVKKKAEETPDTAGIAPKPVTPLAPPADASPPSVGAANAMPKPRPEADVSLKKDSDSLDKQMAEAKVTEEQLQHSNEGQWQAAVGAKREAQSDAAAKPGEYRQQEQATLGAAKGQADTAAQSKLQGMHGQRQAQLQQVQGHQQTAKGKDEQERAKIAAKVESIFGATKGRVEERLKRLDGEVNKVFDEGAAQARKACLDHIDHKMDERYSGPGGWATWVADKFRDINELPEIKAAFAEAKKIYVQRMDQVIDRVAAVVETGLTEAKAEVAKGKQEVATYVQSLPAALRKVGQEAQKEIQGKFAALEQSVKDKQNELVDTLAQKYQESEQQLGEELDKIKAENRGLINKAKEMIGEAIETIMKLKDMLMGMLARAAGVIDKIIQDPIGFLGNLVAGAKAGFMQFGKNIAGHLKEGLIGWLTGALGGAGIQLPTTWDLKGIAQLMMSILGVTWQAIRSRAVKLIGEPAMAFLEKASEMVKLAVTGGPMALWEHLKESVGDIKTMVMDGIKNMVITQVIQAGITWVVSLFNPASAFIRACKMIVDVVMFFVERAAQIGELVNALLDSLEAVVGGNIGAMAAKIEAALGRAIPVVIGFLANLLGLGGIASKIKGIIDKIRAPIEKAIDWVIQKAVGLLKRAGKWLKGKWDKATGKDKKDGKDNDGKDKKDDRTDQQKLSDLHKAVGEVENLAKQKGATAKSIESKLPIIQSRHRLQELALRKQGNKYHVHGKVNPEEDKSLDELLEIVDLPVPLPGGGSKTVRAAKQGNVYVPIDKVTIYGAGKVVFKEKAEYDSLCEERKRDQKAFSKFPEKAARLKKLKEGPLHNYERSQGNLKSLQKAGRSSNSIQDAAEVINHLLAEMAAQPGVTTTAGAKITTTSSLPSPTAKLIVEAKWKVQQHLETGEFIIRLDTLIYSA